ncbi:MAG: ATP-NAD kinase family protein [Thermomicrobiales bacterium]|nr:ATP-NAD kinase family protein [Thermomicrobiales bacterium]
MAAIDAARPRVGLIVNPIAGMGGRVGLKGTDGPDAVERARSLGAVPVSGERAAIALATLGEKATGGVDIVTAPGELGAFVAQRAGFEPIVVGNESEIAGTSHDTIAYARAIGDAGVDLLLFAGGDGTARNIHDAIGVEIPALGIPTGVKMHSSVFGTNPRAAGELAARFVEMSSGPCRESEVMDIDEDAFREGRVSARLFGYLRVKYQRSLVQGLKSGSTGNELSVLNGIATAIGQRMTDDALWILGPGTTTRHIATVLGLPKTLLGVDLYRNRTVVSQDANEQEILRQLDATPARLVVTPIGGQGYLFGRGNQQLSPAVLRRIGLSNIIVVATPGKLAGLDGASLLVDTGDAALDAELRGYVRVIVNQRQESMQRVT